MFVLNLMRRVFHSILSGWLHASTVYLYVLLVRARRGKMYACTCSSAEPIDTRVYCLDIHSIFAPLVLSVAARLSRAIAGP